MAGYALSFALSSKVAFYEKGIHFPQEPSGGRARFIDWSQIGRFYWDGDVLTVVPNDALLSTGGGNIGIPMQGGSVRIPAARQVQVANLIGEFAEPSRHLDCPAVRHSVNMLKIREWATAAARSPKEKLLKERLKGLRAS